MRDNTVKGLLITITAYMMMNFCTVTFALDSAKVACLGPLPPRLRGGLEVEVTLLKPERPNSARPGALLPQISPGRLSHSATTPFLRFSQGPARAGPLSPRLRGSLEMDVAQIKPGGPNSARQAAVQPRISPGRPSRGATPSCLGFGKGPTRAGHLPPFLRGSLEAEEAQIKPEQPNSARPAAVQPQISPGLPSLDATPPCLGFAEGPARAGPLPPSLRGNLETEVALLKSERPNSARPVAVQPRISPGCLSRSVTPPCLEFGKDPACGGPPPSPPQGQSRDGSGPNKA